MVKNKNREKKEEQNSLELCLSAIYVSWSSCEQFKHDFDISPNAWYV